MTILIESRRRSISNVDRDHPGAIVLDVTSKGPAPWLRFSPFYPHGGIPVPLSPGVSGESVEGIWQALKVFERADVDPSKLEVRDMKGLKRSARRFGAVLGHRAGLRGTGLLTYLDARHAIYLPSYRWVLEHPLAELVEELRGIASERDVVLLDYATNADVDDPTRPLSHAALVRHHVERTWPDPSRQTSSGG